MIDLSLLKELTQTWGVSGREKKVRALIRREVEAYADEMFTDALGNLYVLKKGKGGPEKKVIMLSAHMDEIGCQVTLIDPDGKIHLCKDGWVWTASMYNDKVIFQNGTVGVVGCLENVENIHNDITKMFVDIGCTTKEETEKYVKVGDYCGFIGGFYELANGRLCSKTFDDRVGCYMMIEALRANTGDSVNDVWYVFSVQEEVGCRGAVAAAEHLHPDIGISIDVTPDHFYPCDLVGCNEVGKGIGVTFGNPSAILDEYLVSEMEQCCIDNNIPYQRDVMDRGGTDASSMNLSYQGVRVAGISVVDRYPHSQSSVIAKQDVEAGIRLLDLYTRKTFVFEED